MARRRQTTVSERLKDKLVETTPVTADLVRPWQSSLAMYVAAWRIDKLPMFNIWTADLMRYDPQVHFGLQMRNGPLMVADAVVEAPDEEIASWVQKQWLRIWNTSAYKILMTRVYGFMAYEVMYRRERDGFVGFKKLKDLHPSMCRPLTHGNEVKAVRVRPHGSFGFLNSVIGNYPKAKDDHYALYSPKSLWTTYEGRFENPFGEPILEKAYSSWWEKWMENGAKRSAMLRMVKDSWVGDVVYYPHNKTFINAEGQQVSARDLAREITENRMSGGAICLPAIYEDGKQLFQYMPPTGIAGDTKIFEWQELLNLEIWKALGIPKEVLEASGTGSGFSGRSFPFLSFVAGLLTEFQELMRAIDEMILRPLAWINFGTEPDYEIRPIEVDKLIQKLTGGSAQGLGGGGIGMGMPQMPGMAQGMRQFADDAPSVARRHRKSRRNRRTTHFDFGRDSALRVAEGKLPTVEQLVAETGVSHRAAKLARLVVAASSNDAPVSAERLLNAAGIETDSSPITRTLDRVGETLLESGAPRMAYHFGDNDLLDDADEFEEFDPSEDQNDESDFDGDADLDDDDADDDWDNDDEAEMSGGSLDDDDAEDDWEDDGEEIDDDDDLDGLGDGTEDEDDDFRESASPNQRDNSPDEDDFTDYADKHDDED